MAADTITLKTLPAAKIEIAPSRIFTYPTRLAAAWQAGNLEINLPGYCLDRLLLQTSVSSGPIQSHQGSHSGRRLVSGKFAAIHKSEDYIFDARFDTDENIAHILTNAAPGLLLARGALPRIEVILRANASALGKEAYRLLGFPTFCTDGPVSGRLVVATDACEGAYEAWYPTLFGGLEFDGYQPRTPERVFISRKGTRRLLNEQEVEDAVSGYGFRKIYFEDISLAQQWSVTRNASAIAAIHGAALSSLVFHRGAVKVLELFHPGYVVDIYRHITNVAGGTWCGVTGRMPANLIRELDEKQKPRSFAESGIHIDIPALHKAIRYLGIA